METKNTKLEAIVKETSEKDTILVVECEKAELNGVYQKVSNDLVMGNQDDRIG